MWNLHFSLFRVKPFFWILSKAFSSRVSRYSTVFPCTMMSSCIFLMPSEPSNTCCITRWYISGVQLISNINLLYRKSPLWVANVMICLDSSLNSTWWKAHFMSNLVEIVHLLRSCRSLTTALFACLISTHRRRSPLGLGITTIGEIQEVVLSTFSIKLLFQLISYSATTRTRALGRSLSNHNDFWKQKILNFFDKGTNKIQGSTIQPLKTLKPFDLTWPVRKQPSNLWTYWSACLKSWESFVFISRCRDWTIFFQVPRFE